MMANWGQMERTGAFMGAVISMVIGCQKLEKPVAATAANKPRITDTRVFVQIRLKASQPFTDNCGCICYSQNGSPMADGKAKCGYPGAVAEVTWKFEKTTDAGEIYLFTLRSPVDANNSHEETKEVTYTGKEVIIFQDDSHRVGMGPNTEAAQKTAPATLPLPTK